MGEMIVFSGNGHERQGYLAKGNGPGVIVLQEWWGLVGHIKSVADRFAEAGFNALAPDLYNGKATTEPDEAGSLMMAINIAETEKTMSGAVTALIGEGTTKGDKVGIVGFCMGGQLAMYAACVDPRIGACVNFYGVHPDVHPDYANLHGPMLGIFAEHDASTSGEVVSEIDKKLTEFNKPHEFITYPGTKHAFFNNDRPVFDAEAAADAWGKVIAFFKMNLA